MNEEDIPKFVETLNETHCRGCISYSKALVHTNCICDVVMEIITSTAKTKPEITATVATWMTVQKDSRKPK